FLLDRLPGSDTGTVRPSRWIDLSGTPRLRVRTTQGTQGTLRLVSPAQVVIRDANAQPAADVAPSWDAGAIHLTLRPVARTPLRLGPFERVDGNSGYGILTRNAQTNLDVQGTYRATLVDAARPRDHRSASVNSNASTATVATASSRETLRPIWTSRAPTAPRSWMPTTGRSAGSRCTTSSPTALASSRAASPGFPRRSRLAS